MRFCFDEEQLRFQESVRGMLGKECSPERLRALSTSDTGRSPELWAKLAEIGLLGLLVPEQHLGLGLSEVDAVLPLEETGRAALAGPLGIIPYLVAMLVAIGVFRHGGAMDILAAVLSPVTALIGMPAEALPMALMRPLSGSGALGVMSDIISAHGPDSFLGRLVSVMMGSGETTFYVLAVYFGSVAVNRSRHAVPAGIVADLVSLLASVWLVNLIWG